MREREGPAPQAWEGEGSLGGDTLTRLRASPSATLSRGAGEGRGLLPLRHLMSGEMLQYPHQAGMVPALAAQCGGGVEQLLRGGGVGQREVERPRAGQGEAQILLVQFDAEAGIEGALDHP